MYLKANSLLILKYLQSRHDASYVEISAHLHLHYWTVQHHIKSLIALGYLDKRPAISRIRRPQYRISLTTKGKQYLIRGIA